MTRYKIETFLFITMYQYFISNITTLYTSDQHLSIVDIECTEKARHAT